MVSIVFHKTIKPILSGELLNNKQFPFCFSSKDKFMIEQIPFKINVRTVFAQNSQFVTLPELVLFWGSYTGILAII